MIVERSVKKNGNFEILSVLYTEAGIIPKLENTLSIFQLFSAITWLYIKYSQQLFDLNCQMIDGCATIGRYRRMHCVLIVAPSCAWWSLACEQLLWSCFQLKCFGLMYQLFNHLQFRNFMATTYRGSHVLVTLPHVLTKVTCIL